MLAQRFIDDIETVEISALIGPFRIDGTALADPAMGAPLARSLADSLDAQNLATQGASATISCVQTHAMTMACLRYISVA